MAATEARRSDEPKTKRRDGVSITIKGGGHGGGLLIIGGTLLAAAVGAAFAYHQSRANKKTTTPSAIPPADNKDFVNGDARTEHQSLIRNEVASANGPAVESLVSRSIKAVIELISEEVADVGEVEQLVEMDSEEGEGTMSSMDEDDERGEEGSDGTGLSLVESSGEVEVWPAELIDKGRSLTRHDVVCTGDPAVESSSSDVVEIASEQTSEELPSLATMDVKEVEMQADMNIQEDDMLFIIGSQGEGSDSSVDEEGEGGEEGSDGSSGLSALESSAEAAVWPTKLIDDNCRKIRLAGGDERMELIRHDQLVSAEIFKSASEPISVESPTTDYVKEVKQLVELYLEEDSIPPIIRSKVEGIDSSIDQSSTEAVLLEELITREDKSLATESKEKEEAQQYFLPTASEAANNESSVTDIVKEASRPFMEESPVAVDVEETEQIVEMKCEEGQIPSATEPRTEAVWLADLIDEVKKSSATELQEKEEPKQYVLSTASQAATEESSLSEIVRAASEPNMEELLATEDVQKIEQQVNMNHREGGIRQTIGFQGEITGLAIDQSTAEPVCPAELISQEDKSLATESPEKEEPQQYVLQSANQAASNESYVFELVKGARQLIIEEPSFITEVEEIEQTVEVNHGERKLQSIIESREEGTDPSVDEEDEGGEVESDGTGSSTIESSAEAIWPAESINEEERRPLITEQTEKEELQEIVKLTASQTFCTETFVSAAIVRKMTMRNYTNGYSRALVMLLALILVLGILSVAHGDLLQCNHHLG